MTLVKASDHVHYKQVCHLLYDVIQLKWLSKKFLSNVEFVEFKFESDGTYMGQFS